MSMLGNYLFKKVITITLITLFAITLLLFFMQATKYLDLIISKGLKIKYLFQIAFLSMPAIWNELVPITIFLAILFTLQLMINNNEIVIMQAIGLSPWQISKSILLIGVISSVICFLFSLFIINNSYMKFLKLRDEIKNNFNIRVIGSNQFMQLTKDITIYIEKINKTGLLEKVLIDNQTVDNEYAIYAESARILNQNHELKIILNNGSIQKLNKVNKTVSFMNFDFYILNIPEAKNNTEIYERTTAKKLFLWELLFYKNLEFMQKLKIENINEYNNRAKSFIIEINKRCVNIVLSIAFAVIAAYFFSKNTFNRRTQFLALFKSLITGISLKIFCTVVLITTSNMFLVVISYSVVLLIAGYMTIAIKKI